MSSEANSASLSDQLWINYPRAQRIQGALERIMGMSKRPRMPGCLIVGEPSNGKTTLVQRFISKHPRHRAESGESFVMPIVSINSPHLPDERELYVRILTAMQAPFSNGARPGDHFRQICYLAQRLDVKMLIIDEVHNQLAGALNKQKLLANAIKGLHNELGVAIVLVGTELAYNALQIDAQLSTRFPSLELPKWHFDDDFRRLLLSFKKAWNIEFDSEKLGPRILALSNATIGGISQRVENAAWRAKSRGSSNLKPEDFEGDVW